MMELEALQALMVLEREGTYSAASRAMGVPRTTLKRMIERLEEAIGAPLVVHTTRHLRLTHAGRVVAAEAPALLEAARQLRVRARRQAEDKIRVAAPTGLGVSMLAVIHELEARAGFTGSQVEFVFTDRRTHPVRDDVDLAITLDPSALDGDLRSHFLMRFDWRCHASPDYPLGEDAGADALGDHPLIAVRVPGGPDPHAWPLLEGGEAAVEPRYVVNSSAAARELARGGAGVALLPLITPDEARGLRPVLPGVGARSALYAIMGQGMRGSALERYLRAARLDG
jgi:DNA-binding transcriptional LysR family regulator